MASPHSGHWSVARACLRFHAASGARVALRNSILGTAVAVFVMGMAPQPPGLFLPLCRGVAGAESSPLALVLVAMLGGALARQAVPQLSAGHAGWPRSLPASGDARRRALVGALVIVQAPVLVFILCAWVIVALSPAWHVSPLKLLACALIPPAAAMLVVPAVQRGTVAVASLLALAAASTATGIGLLVSLLALFAADRLARDAGYRAVRSRSRRVHGAASLPYRIAWRAMSWRALAPIASAVLPLGGAWLMYTNNHMVGAERTTVMRVGGTLAVVLVLAGLANVLQLQRPVWVWARSLPTSAAQRVGHDATSLAVGVIPVWIAVAAVDLRAAAAVVALTPMIALLAAAAMRRAGARITGAQGEIVSVGLFVVIAVGVASWLTVACVLLTPAMLRFATRRERRSIATQWAERHHSTAGDGLAWNGP